jgi:hypothetical protein
MSLEEKILEQLRGLQLDMNRIMVAIKGDHEMGVNGIQQQLEDAQKDIRLLKDDVSSLKTDRGRLKAWVAGIGVALGALGHKIINHFSQ